MTVTPNISLNDGNLTVHGKTLLKGVPENIVLTPGSGVGLVAGSFIGATASHSKSLHVFPVGVLEDIRFMCLFRFKLWWMTQRMGTCGKDVPLETQFMLVESKGASEGQHEDSPTIYTVFLPLLEGQFRAVLQGNERNELEICLESGDNAVETNQGLYLVYVHAGTNPFEVINQAVKAVEKHLQTFQHREKKKIPDFLDWFGWCTWDAFYTDVTAEGVEDGIRSLTEGGTPPRFLIIDDGWQQIGSEVKESSDCVVQEGAQFANRLTGIKENEKFQKSNKPNEQETGLKSVVKKAKEQQNVKYVYVWHALAGYWGGVHPAGPGMEHYETSLAYPVQSPGILGNQPDIVMDSLAVHGLGLVHPRKVFNFYNELHAYLASCGVDGVKVDVQNIIETLGAGHGGRVSLTRSYHQALEASVSRNFPDNGCIACMCHNTDGIYSAKQTAVVRASDDFYPRDPASHTIHISSVAYNTVFLGEFMQPDWDMFHSLHPAADYHAAARAVGGCAIYVSDKPGNHNFELLKKLVLPDGSILRAQLPGRPTLDCLFVDPARDGTSLLKVWNANKCSGVVGVFNCQGAGWCRVTKRTRIHDASPGTLTGSVQATDVDALPQIAGSDWTGDTVVYAYRTKDVVRLPEGASLPVTLNVLEYELFHFCPVKHVTDGISFAPIGLLDMFNTTGAVDYYEIKTTKKDSSDNSNGIEPVKESRQPVATITIKVRGCGRFGAYCSKKPRKCSVDCIKTAFDHDSASGLVTLTLPTPGEEMYRWSVDLVV
ncbi:probable galactinol--sucrose galactosyltransferase 2 isoform X2 [Andrographis paniculata]|nr:probable galactinol--sucrose galactosyltransferase 2 isoform X2 [Andrographis paniculata]XP_051148817.1 probable galactinol--sucrose galactosyltransferase 2 isoform X2 [Andrographis paniculata]XP_051148818.1 probable galactinol--sucrose galactosyltransferase 2 isoform X2 [Andrographis paniculata]XP_051148819.1 probable galactinol--sucrose galactosyltransferase 2 isoform X2 [Andrographis paniculata]XP_051148820.1 probable galactinol--sucrose galactosyltransferase 2 isoform X2 [Andrographis pa